MKWFGGSIPEAIQLSKNSGSLFVVYIYGDDENSSRLNNTWDDENVSQHHLQANCVAIKLHANSEQGRQFSQIYPVVMVPCVFYIGKNGVPLEVSGGFVQAAELDGKLTSALRLHNAQSETNVPPTQHVQPGGAAQQTEPAAPRQEFAEPTVDQQQQQSVSSTADAQSDMHSGAEQSASEGGASAAASSSQVALDEKKERALELLARKRDEKAREDEEKEKQDEIKRRKLGQELGKLKQWKDDRQRAELENSYKKQKEEERLARERVRAEIERDRQERAAKFEREKTDRETAVAARNAEKLAAKAEAEAQLNAARMQQARIQFRLPDGSSITNTFQSSENLAAARAFILQRLPSSCRAVTLTTVYPKREFTDADMHSSLLELGLAPSAILVVLFGVDRSSSPADGVGGLMGIVWGLLAPLIWIWSAICTFLFAKPSPAVQPQSHQTTSESANSRQPNAESSSVRQRTRRSDGTKRRVDGNIHRLTADDSDDETATWNGNSTQQM